MNKTKRNYMLVFVVFATMLTISISENAKGIFVPIFKDAFQINDAKIGVLLLVTSCSYMTGSYFAGHLIDLINRKRTMLLGTFLLLSGIFMLSFTKHIIFFYFSFSLSNIGMAFMALSVNTLIPKLNVKSTAIMMNLVHFSYGIGATATHKTCGLLLERGLSYKEIYHILLGISAFLFIVIVFTKFKNEGHEKIENKISFHKGEKHLIFILALGLGLYISAEIQTGNWMIEYIKTGFGYTENTASNYSSLFFLFFTVGRLFGGVAAEKLGYLKSVIISTSIATILYFIGLLMGAKGLILISISGIFFSIVFPIVMLSVNDFFKESLNRASGLILTIASGTNMLMGFVIGYTSKLLGIQNAMYWIPTVLLISTLLILSADKKGYTLVKNRL